MVIIPWGTSTAPSNKEETVLLQPLLAFLHSTNRVNGQCTVKRELPWNGRRIDLATITKSLTTAAYELKLSSITRAIEQASYSRLSFDRSWVVTQGKVGQSALDEAARLGIGIMSLQAGKIRIVISAKRQPRTSRTIRRRLIDQLRSQEVTNV